MATAADFDVEADVRAINEAIDSSNKDQLISILCARNLEQRREIATKFQQTTGIPLEQKLQSLFDGDSQKIMIALVIHPIIFYTDELYAAFEKLRTRFLNVFSTFARPTYKTIANILCILSNQAINDLKSEYNNKYERNLEKEIRDNLSLQLNELLLKLCRSERDETENIDLVAAEADINELSRVTDPYNADESPFIDIFGSRSFKQLEKIIEGFKTLTEEPIETRIETLFNNEDVLGYRAIVHYSENKYYFFARCLYDGLNSGNSTLVGLVLLQCDDLIKVKRLFELNFGDSLRDFIKAKASRHYKYALYTLFGEKRSNN